MMKSQLCLLWVLFVSVSSLHSHLKEENESFTDVGISIREGQIKEICPYDSDEQDCYLEICPETWVKKAHYECYVVDKVTLSDQRVQGESELCLLQCSLCNDEESVQSEYPGPVLNQEIQQKPSFENGLNFDLIAQVPEGGFRNSRYCCGEVQVWNKESECGFQSSDDFW